MLVGTAGHLHPGGLWTDLYARARRPAACGCSARARSTSSRPAPCRGTSRWRPRRPDWRVGVKRGDMLTVSATYDSKRASWYEAMGIMATAFNPGGTGPDPFAVERRRARPADPRPPGREPQPRRRILGPGRPAPAAVGAAAAEPHDRDQRLPLRPRRPAAHGVEAAAADDPAAAARCGSSTATRSSASCTRSPRARRPATARRASPTRWPTGPVRFDSGNLGFGPAFATAAANRDDVADAARPARGHVHLLLQDPPVHARRVPRQGPSEGLTGRLASAAIRRSVAAPSRSVTRTWRSSPQAVPGVT